MAKRDKSDVVKYIRIPKWLEQDAEETGAKENRTDTEQLVYWAMRGRHAEKFDASKK